MKFIPAKIPQFIKRIFPNYVWDFSSKDKTLYLTFDDGPTPEITQWTLNTLKPPRLTLADKLSGHKVNLELFQLFCSCVGHSALSFPCNTAVLSCMY